MIDTASDDKSTLLTSDRFYDRYSFRWQIYSCSQTLRRCAWFMSTRSFPPSVCGRYWTSHISCFLCRSSGWKSWRPPQRPAHLLPPATRLHPRPLPPPSPRPLVPLDPAMTCWASTATPLLTTCNPSWPTPTARHSPCPATPSELPPSSSSKPMASLQVGRDG